MQLNEGLRIFIRDIKPTDHIVLFYDNAEAKRSIVYNYLAEGLEKGRGIVYVCGEETPKDVREGLASLGVDVEPNERSENILIKTYEGWYLENNTVDSLKIINKWNDTAKKFSERGLGTRVSGEVSKFFQEGRVRELLRYEYALHKVMTIPMETLCSYDLNSIVQTGYTDMIMPIVRAHGKAIFASKGGNVIIEPEIIEDTDVEKLLEIKV
jgi:hypothetical protein